MSFSGLIAVGAGAALGAWLRWALGLALNPLLPTLPLGTLAANLVGGLLMGVAMGLVVRFDALGPTSRLLLMTGFLGGLTFSTFSAETATLLLRRQYGWTSLLVGAHLFGSVAMTFAGMAAVGWLSRRGT